MRESDYETFSTLLRETAELYPNRSPLSSMQKAMYFRALAEFSLDQVQGALDAHMKSPPPRCSFFPMPGEIIAQINATAAVDGRPGPEEAWAIAIKAADENATLLWTEEMAQAWGICRAVYAGGDEVGARMAFKETYTRLVASARAERRPAVWTASLGQEAPAERAKAIELQSARLGLPSPHVAGLLPAPEEAKFEMPTEVRARLGQIAKAIAERAQGNDAESAVRARVTRECAERHINPEAAQALLEAARVGSPV